MYVSVEELIAEIEIQSLCVCVLITFHGFEAVGYYYGYGFVETNNTSANPLTKNTKRNWAGCCIQQHKPQLRLCFVMFQQGFDRIN